MVRARFLLKLDVCLAESPAIKILFFQKQDGEVVISNASSQAIHKAQAAFAGAAETMGITSEDDIQTLVDEVRYGKAR